MTAQELPTSKSGSYGEVYVDRVYADGRTERVFQHRNTLTYAYLASVAGLLTQRSDELDAESRKLGSIWFEAYAGSQPDATPDDSGPHALSEVIAQKAIEDSARRSYTVDDSVVVEATVLLDAEEGNGNTISFLGLYSHGTGVIPDGDTFTAGTNDVFCLARLRLGIDKNDGFALRAGWRIVLTIVSE